MNGKTVAISLAIAFIAGWMVNGWRLDQRHTEEKLENVQQQQQQYQQKVTVVHEKAVEYVDKSAELNEQISNLKKELANAKKRKPLPADCRPDDERMRIIRDAVRSANSATGQQPVSTLRQAD